MDSVTTLKLAIAGSRYGRGDARLASRARELGAGAFAEVLEALGRADQDRVTHEAEDLCARGVSAVLLGSAGYPSALGAIRSPPQSLFCLGQLNLLAARGIGMCGSRDGGAEGIRA